MPKKEVKQAAKKEDDSKLFAFLAVFLSILGFIIALLAKKDNKYVMFYAKQSLILFICWVVAWIVGMIPVIGWFVLGPILYIVVLVLWIIGLVYSISGEMKLIPLVGKYADKINL